MRYDNRMLARGLVLLLGLMVVSSGCGKYKYEPHGYKSNTYGTSSDSKSLVIHEHNRQFGALSASPTQHDNQFFEYSSKLSRGISRMDGISSAIVMLTDRNAYVAIVFNQTGIRTKTGGRARREQALGANEGVYNHTTGSPYWDNRQLATPYGSALTVNDHNEIPDGLKQSIALKIRKMAPLVQEVHISANRQFVNRFLDYAKKSWLNESLTPYLDDFNTLVANQFAGGNKMPARIDKIDPTTHGADRNNGTKNGIKTEVRSGATTGPSR
ncbi:conserved hypothetical protein [Paenibacillus curdlanolyticus YK9]|uniref:Sporulation lipoprotein YhcN/YlaJ-like protein n=1 Tax=Paenibacillus curdlanolyticus YK9 TaxID=717606 RepID=E0I7U9_9BACL|nr:hypothetical protein [Paenibacillus curdlanolyticus]EFM11254.1 conserved hypothetical protein [Paenibacillus curdlanolyticus YK9]